jgi:flagellar basal-body rod modification protein FlgD
MTVTASGGVSNLPTSAANATQKTSKDQFLRLFLTQLQNQNPLEPMQDRDFLMQLAQFTQVENAEKTASILQKLHMLLSATQATALLGKHVIALPEGEVTPIEGKVSAVRFTADGVWLMVNGAEVAAQNVLQVRE